MARHHTRVLLPSMANLRWAFVLLLVVGWITVGDRCPAEQQPSAKPDVESATETAEMPEKSDTPVASDAADATATDDAKSTVEPAEATAAADEATESEPADGPITGPRDLLDRFGIDDSFFAKLVDGEPIDGNEDETLMRIMYRLRDFREVDLEQWARPNPKLAELVKDRDANQGQVYHLVGRVTGIEKLEPIAEVVERFELKHYFRCVMQLEPSGQPAIVFARRVPEAWQNGQPLDARAGAFGVFLKFASNDPEHPTPVFVARRIAWYPSTLLGTLGMDVGLFDSVENRTRLSGQDREAFYQMLAAVGRAKPGQLIHAADERLKEDLPEMIRTDKDGQRYFSVVPLFNEPAEMRGQLVELMGTARRVVKVRVSDEDIIARFGIDHYYNLFIYTDDSQDNPLVFCVRDLPQGMPIGDDPQYAETVRVAGFFFKSWAYGVDQGYDAPEGTVHKRQLAPLLIGQEPVWYRREPPARNTLAGAIAGGLFVVMLLGIWVAVWRYNRSDQKFQQETLSRALSGESDVSLNELGLNAETEPDFSGLAQMDNSDEGAEAKDGSA